MTSMNKSTDNFTTYALSMMTLAFLIFLMWLLPPSKNDKPAAAPSRVVCLIFDLSIKDGQGRWKGWHPVSEEVRDEVGLLVNAGAAEWFEADSAACYERHPKNPKFGQVIERHYVEWWRWVEKSKKRTVIKH